MSSHHDRSWRGDHRREDRSRDQRERSPGRGSYDRRDRTDDRYQSRDGGRGGRGGGRGDRGGGRGDRGGRGGRGGFGGPSVPYDLSLPQPKQLSPLPSTVPIPSDGSKLPVTMARPNATRGRHLEVYTNHYMIQSLPIIRIYTYELRFTVAATSQRGPRGSVVSPALIEKAWTAANVGRIFGTAAVFNGVSLLWSPDLLIEPDAEGLKRIQLPDHSETRPNEVDVHMRHLGTAKIADLVAKFKEDPTVDINSGLLWLNSLFRHYPSSQPTWVSRPKGLSFFIRESGSVMGLQSTGGLLEAIRGLHQGISTHFNLLSVNVDTSTTAFYVPNKPLTEVLMAFAGNPGAPPTELLNPAVNLRELSQQLTGLYFCVTHAGPERRVRKFRAKGLHFVQGRLGTAATTTFMKTDPATGQETTLSIQQYFQDRYQVQIRYPDFPLVDSAAGLFPIEFCCTAPGERYREVLEGQETADFIKFATAPAFERSKQIDQCVKRLEWHSQTILPAHGISISPKMMTVPARKLEAPRIQYARSFVNVQNGSWNLRGVTFINAKQLSSWGVLYLPKTSRPGQVSKESITQFFRMFHSELTRYGLTPPNGPPAVVIGQAQADVMPMINKVGQATCEQFRCKTPGMIFILLHQGMPTTYYKAIKTVCEVEYGIPSQCMIVEKSLLSQRGQAQYVGNVALKINSKLGGVNSRIALPGRFAAGGTMILGADVTHPSAAQLRQVPAPPSIAALTGTFDVECCRYTAVASPQQTTQESIAAGPSMPCFVGMAETLCERFAEKNSNRPPPVVLYFRDGVSDSQIDELKGGEIKLLRELVAKWNGKLTAIIAQKRHHTRFFPVERSSDRNGNIEPGTVVESGQGSAFVCGHGALQGTVRPSHFRIIHDDNSITADEFHALIMHGVHTYSKATRAVHTHAAIYYADLVAERSTARVRTRDNNTYFVDVNSNLKWSMWWQ